MLGTESGSSRVESWDGDGPGEGLDAEPDGSGGGGREDGERLVVVQVAAVRLSVFTWGQPAAAAGSVTVTVIASPGGTTEQAHWTSPEAKGPAGADADARCTFEADLDGPDHNVTMAGCSRGPGRVAHRRTMHACCAASGIHHPHLTYLTSQMHLPSLVWSHVLQMGPLPQCQCLQNPSLQAK